MDKYRREIYVIKSKDSGEFQSKVNKFIKLNGDKLTDLNITFNSHLNYHIAYLDYKCPEDYKVNNKLI